jgi:hypothetical protein
MFFFAFLPGDGEAKARDSAAKLVTGFGAQPLEKA